jgi:triosephosphate isomerase
MTTPTWIGTSWKMNKLLAEAKAFASRLRECPTPPAVQRFVIPAFPAIHTVAVALGPDSDVIVGAQNAHWEDAGAWTGEVSVPQVKDAGATLVEIAYEPVWAIGEAGRAAEPEDLEPSLAALTDALNDRVRAILYGGSVTTENAAGILAVPGVDGLFVGRAAWEVQGYLALVELAARHSGRELAGASSTPTAPRSANEDLDPLSNPQSTEESSCLA